MGDLPGWILSLLKLNCWIDPRTWADEMDPRSTW